MRDLAIGKRQSIVAGGECSKTDINFRPCILSLSADGSRTIASQTPASS